MSSAVLAPPKARPIIYGAESIIAIQKGLKTETRRVIKIPAKVVEVCNVGFTALCPPGYIAVRGGHASGEFGDSFVRCPYGVHGDLLWVREAFWQSARYPFTMPSGEASPLCMNWGSRIHYAADGDPPNTANRHYPEGLRNGAFAAPDPDAVWIKRPSIYMTPRQSRITQVLKGVRVERLHDITLESIYAEGLTMPRAELYPHTNTASKMLTRFMWHWDAINGKRHPWSSNPWVWVLTTEVAHV
jgi:hypothetical protein